MLQEVQEQLTNFTTHNDLLQYLKSNGINYVRNNQLGLMILKYDKRNEECNFENPFTRFCRGLVIDMKTRRIVCSPPEKSINFTGLMSNVVENDIPWNQVVAEDFIDGTMINVFNYKNEWHISTRSRIGANCRWLGSKSFSEMFNDAKGTLDFNQFDPTYCYTFVLRHPDNRIVMKYDKADIILVQMRNMNTFETIDNAIAYHTLKQHGIELFIPYRFTFNNIDEITNNISNMSWEHQGIVFKYGNIRYKLRNEQYNYVKNLRGNNSKAFYNYLELRNNKMIKHYLQYFPESDDEFREYRNLVHNKTQDLHICYIDYRIKKTITFDEIPYEFRPLMYELHGFHLNQGVKITFDFVKNYFNNLPIKKIIFVINYQKNKEFHERKMNNTESMSDNEVQDEDIKMETQGNKIILNTISSIMEEIKNTVETVSGLTEEL